MATARTTSHTTATTLFTAPEHQRGVITGINIDNQSAAACKLILQDVFTPDASVGQTSPSAQTIARLQITVATLQSVSIDKNSLENVKILGIAKILGDAISTSVVIVANYHFE